jgi:hypothetical protein
MFFLRVMCLVGVVPLEVIIINVINTDPFNPVWFTILAVAIMAMTAFSVKTSGLKLGERGNIFLRLVLTVYMLILIMAVLAVKDLLNPIASSTLFTGCLVLLTFTGYRPSLSSLFGSHENEKRDEKKNDNNT